MLTVIIFNIVKYLASSIFVYVFMMHLFLILVIYQPSMFISRLGFLPSAKVKIQIKFRFFMKEPHSCGDLNKITN